MLQWSIQDATFESNCLHRDYFVPCRNLELGNGRQTLLGLCIDEVPLFDASRIRLFRGNQGELQNRGSYNAQLIRACRRQVKGITIRELGISGSASPGNSDQNYEA